MENKKKISLRDITCKNWKECISLKTEKLEEYPPLIYERYIASNCLSLAQAKVEPLLKTKGIYLDDEMIGFTMFGYCEEKKFYEIYRIMIDFKHQGCGYSKIAMKLIIAEMKNETNCKEMFVFVSPSNKIAINLYEAFGFKKMDKIVYSGELTYLLLFNK